MSKITAVIGKDRHDPCRLIQMYVDGNHIGYVKIENSHVSMMRKMLEANGAVIVNTTGEEGL